MDVARNRIEDGPVGIREGSDTVRIDDNDLIDSRSSAIHVGGRKPAYDIDIRRNRIRGAMENGIATGFFDTEGVADGIVMGLRIVGNEIVGRSEEHTSELQSLMRTSYAVFCLKKKKDKKRKTSKNTNQT